jgi:tRNA(fMet)-specific endonuclease VapC
MKKIVLDTNAFSAFFAGSHEVLGVLSEAEQVFMSTIVLGELYAGFRGGSREGENTGNLESFLKRGTVRTLVVSRETAEIFGTVKYQLKSQGTPIPLNDVWIAAHTIETGSQLVTYDRHFSRVAGLRVWSGSPEH